MSPSFVSFPGVTTFARSGKAVADVRPAAQRDRDLRRADGADDDRRERRLVAARGSAHRAHAEREGDPRQRRWRPDEARSAEGHDPARRTRRRSSRSGSRLTLTLASSSTAQSSVEPPLPRPPDGADGSRARRHRRAEASGPAHAGHEVIARAAAVALAALALVATAGASPSADPGVTASSVLLGGTVPLTGEAAAFGTRRPGREGVLRLREREGRRERPEDRVPLLRRRLQPGADRPADTQARRAGQGLRGLQLGRDGEQPRGARLPERAEGAAALRRRRLAVDRPRLRALPVDDGLPPELPRRGRRLRQDDREVEAEGAHRGARTRTPSSASTCSPASRARSPGRARESSRSSRTSSPAPTSRRRSRS